MAKIVMVLAHSPIQPEGDIDDRIELLACLTVWEQLDADAYYAAPLPWPTLHTRPGGPTRHGEITRVDDSWILGNFHDEELSVFNAAAIRPGEIVMLQRLGGDVLLYRIVAVIAD
jgi:hypothetical protein